MYSFRGGPLSAGDRTIGHRYSFRPCAHAPETRRRGSGFHLNTNSLSVPAFNWVGAGGYALHVQVSKVHVIHARTDSGR